MSEKPKFWEHEKFIFVMIFVVGFVVGAIIVNQVIDPVLYSSQSSDYNAISELNNRLDTRNDELYNCLIENAIDTETC